MIDGVVRRWCRRACPWIPRSWPSSFSRRNGGPPLFARHRSVGRWGHEAAVERKRSRHRSKADGASCFHRCRRERRAYPVLTVGRTTGLPGPGRMEGRQAMSRLLGFYETQLRVLWEWRGGRVALLKRLLITLVVATISFLATAGIFRSWSRSTGSSDAVVAVILIALFNAAIRPVILALAAPVSLILVGGPRARPPGGRRSSWSPSWAPGVHVDGFLDGAARLVHLRDHQHDPDRDPRRRQRRLLLRHARPAADGQAVRRATPTSRAW